MPKYNRYMEELQAWQDLEFECLIEPEPELDPHYAGIIQGEDWYTDMLYGDYSDYWDEDSIDNINDFDYEDYEYPYYD